MNVTRPKLVFQCGKNIAEISWPAYTPSVGGTCEFMTEQCAKYCKLVTNTLEQESYFQFRNTHYQILIDVILDDMRENNSTVLSWWIGSGDCPATLTEKVILIMNALLKKRIKQNGFTRNVELWKQAPSNVKLCLTVEGELNSYLDTSTNAGKLIAIPNYQKQTVKIQVISKKSWTDPHYYTCGGGWVIRREKDKADKVFIEDCSLCMKQNIGCYTA